ncbi:hypothetical protein CcaCcLH18_04698 [Colletotrichum camelliae]|nr:hypothetical protein CcaCcLH18_04698 [Colletotrichum camelliae]
MAAQPTPAELLFAANSREELPKDQKTLDVYGFARCRSLPDVVPLYHIYDILFKSSGITPQTLHQWRSDTALNFIGRIQGELRGNSSRLAQHCYSWLVLNQDIFDFESAGATTTTTTRTQTPKSMSVSEINSYVKSRFPDRKRYEEMMTQTILNDPSVKRAIETGELNVPAQVKELADMVYGNTSSDAACKSDGTGNDKPVSLAGTTTEILFKDVAAFRDPTDPQTLTDYAFRRCHFAFERLKLLKIYGQLTKNCGISEMTVHEWMKGGQKSLGLQVKAALAKSKNVSASLVAFANDNQWIWDDKDAEGEIRSLWSTPDLEQRFKKLLKQVRDMDA